MRFIFIRHAEPDYEHNTITEKGHREAAILAQRIKNWQVDRFYCSPLGRAQDTARPSLELLGRKAVTLDWLQEFRGTAYNEITGSADGCWDMYPECWTAQPALYGKDHWDDAPLLAGTNCRAEYDDVIRNLDGLLASCGYHREQNCYRVERHSDETLVCFCHLGITCIMLSHLLGISPIVLLHSLFIPASSVTIVQSEERNPAIASFRCQSIGDTSHLYAAGEPVSWMASFAHPFQERPYSNLETPRF
ncbi:MAG: histidine phosphatase family protein [Oscillospiraceae bacterium]|nr:histidine phosphatase family protein [Oscillospiraceae bacterium]